MCPKQFMSANVARLPKISSIRNNWLYLQTLSVLDAEPVFIWPIPIATDKSAMVVSSVSPDL